VQAQQRRTGCSEFRLVGIGARAIDRPDAADHHLRGATAGPAGSIVIIIVVTASSSTHGTLPRD
jgi:hypothetical protein